MRREPVWLTRLMVDAVHQDQLLEHGGLPGIRDQNGLEAALARPRNRRAYEPESDLEALAAGYGYGLATGHPFNDGNKRTAFLAIYTFLGLNGREIEAPEQEVVLLMTDLAAGRLSEAELARWLRGHLVPVAGAP
jgi:death-on-curing protein